MPDGTGPPETGHPDGFPRTAPERLAAFPERLYVWSFPRWKWRFVRRCFPDRELRFTATADRIRGPAGVVLWGSAPVPAGLPTGMPVLRMEDGFLRSVGLGAELVRPLSWVVDTRGLHYDARAPSDLEGLLQHAAFPSADLGRAARFRDALVAAGASKYNVGRRRWQRPSGARRVLLVPGQVESDAAMAGGAPGIRHNLALLRTVREAHPGALVVYKPHPDVEAGLRRSGAGEDQAARWCDAVVTGVPMEALLAEVDEVHTLTSLTGFEALLRGIPVTCYGQPFYAGWGLTTDTWPVPRRQRTLSVDALTAAALLWYPLYLGRDGPTTPEAALEELCRWKSRAQGKDPWWQGLYRALLRQAIGVR